MSMPVVCHSYRQGLPLNEMVNSNGISNVKGNVNMKLTVNEAGILTTIGLFFILLLFIWIGSR